MLWWIIGGVAIALVVAAVLFIRRRKTAGALTSIVLMRSGPLHLTEAHVLAAAKRVFKDDASVASLPLGDTKPPGLLAGFAILLSGAPVFYVISADRPYGEAADADNIGEAKVRQVFKSHKAWVSVDVVGGAPPAKMRSMVMMSLAVVAAGLMDKETVLLYATWLGRTAFPSDMKKAGESGNVDAIFTT